METKVLSVKDVPRTMSRRANRLSIVELLAMHSAFRDVLFMADLVFSVKSADVENGDDFNKASMMRSVEFFMVAAFFGVGELRFYQF